MSLNERNYDSQEWSELQTLVDRSLDGRIDEAEVERLEALLLNNSAAQDFYLASCQLHNLIDMENRASRVVDRMRMRLSHKDQRLLIDRDEFDQQRHSPIRLWHRRTKWLAAVSAMVAAASILLGVCLWLFNDRLFSPIDLADSGTESKPTETTELPIADNLPNLENDNTFQQVVFEFGAAAETVALGDFGNAILEGPGRGEWMSPMQLKLHQGRIRVRIEKPSGHSFTVITPSTTVTDLGTEFAIDVAEDQASTVVVFDGMVDLNYSNPEESEPDKTRRLVGGDGVRVSATGVIGRLMAIVTGENSTFSHLTEYTNRPTVPLILDVSDNVIGLESKRFYEIVPGGLREDAKAYVDRPGHEWNGVDELGMPEYLKGLDYIKTYNGDKRRQHLMIDVTLSRAADVYIFFDSRLPAPEWLLNDFRDTGDKIGLDMGIWRGPDGQLIVRQTAGVGPGVSIDTEFTIWVRRVENAGVVRLGPAAGQSGFSAMYGIAVAELEGY